MATKKQLVNAVNKTIDYHIKLSIALQKLSEIASELYGENLTADICGGGEIEFRTDLNGYPDAMSCIRLEDILEKIN